MVNYEKFVKQFMDSWKNLEGEKTCNLMAKKLEYYENPIDPPYTSVEQVKPLWSVVPKNQKDVSYSGEIIFQNDEHCVYHFVMTRTMVATNKKQLIDGLCEFKLNANNKLTFFKQWRFTKEL